MCAIEPIYRFDVSVKRLDAVSKVLGDMMTKLNQQQFLDVLMEIGLADGLKWVDGKPTMNMTELQQCALAAALAAAAEGGCKMVVNDRYKDPSDIFELS